ncbi:MAG: transcriptional repressor LexA [Anaerolineae bacterium]
MASKKPLSDRQRRMLDFIGDFSDSQGYPPTIRDIGHELGISSTSVVSYNLKILEKEGYIKRDETVSRGLKVIRPENGDALIVRRTIEIPVLGTIAAGSPLLLPDAGQYEPTSFIELTRDLVADGRDIYALRVKGDSMIDALVNDGDIVILHRQEQVENGQMAAVWLEDRGETTLKYFYHEQDRVRLKPANPTMKPWTEPAENVRVQGKVIAVIRQL